MFRKFFANLLSSLLGQIRGYCRRWRCAFVPAEQGHTIMRSSKMNHNEANVTSLQVLIWDGAMQAFAAELSFSHTVLAVRMREDRSLTG